MNLIFIVFSILTSCYITGDFTNAQVDLEGNSLTEFRAEVFKSMLDQMAVQPPIETTTVNTATSTLQTLALKSPRVGGQVIVTGSKDFIKQRKIKLILNVLDW